ncbi:alpha/beta hydrolase [Caballeronia sp. LZ019]|uniref:alpha/beta fold hydrolase n=1 Tax=Caballeronia sp. LZ019 TaxID=3038555 RepID=UPI00285AB49B|nr:alpha/beta hydrolase [Caballeronia sp. LZ019]MDR5809167.1 alpha/beta hydrolase [Caballeronia sp. LZ019]
MKLTKNLTRIAAALALVTAGTIAQPAMAAPVKNIVLVHGFFADGSGWQAVSNILTRDGYNVSVVQEPETSFKDDVSATQRVVDAQDGPAILVGHSYGGAVITEAGNDARVAGLVYVAAFEPDVGESLHTLTSKMPGQSKAIKSTNDGHLYLDPAHFRADFAADVPAGDTAFMSRSQVMPAVEAFTAPVTQPAWKTKPSWAIVASDDRTVNPDLERWMAKRANSAIVNVPSSHAAYLSHPAEVARVIERAATASADH